jgi:hypothetical protein
VLTFIKPSGTPTFILRRSFFPLHACHDKVNF